MLRVFIPIIVPLSHTIAIQSDIFYSILGILVLSVWLKPPVPIWKKWISKLNSYINAASLSK